MQPALGVAASVSGRRWRWHEASRQGEAIAERLGLPEIVGRLLHLRGVGLDDAADFLGPTLRALLPDPSVLADMDVAAERLARAVRRGETVGVFGDYDVDGACSGALVARVLRGLGCTVHGYVPDRMAEGYGPNLPALGGLVARGASLIVCVDCGTAAGAVLAGLVGADILVLDHHKAEGVPTAALATVNPNRIDDGSGLGALCATGVAFLAMVALVRTLRRAGFFAQRREPDLLGLLDLVALATVCDMMPLVGLNRAFVTQGLRVLARRERPGLAALLAIAQGERTEAPDSRTLGFGLGPRINAAGRISEADMGLRLLLTEDAGEARHLAAALDGINRRRQTVEAGMLDEAVVAATAQLAEGRAVLLLAGAWHAGVVGIVAGRIKQRFNRPVCVAAVAEGHAKGSGRSVTGHDLGAAVIAARQLGLLATGGGHAMAAGFSVAETGLPGFHAFLDERLAAAAALPRAADLAIEASVTVAGATAALAETLARLAPFGQGNEEPVFAVPNGRVVRADRVGQDRASVRMILEGEGGGRLKAMLFRAADEPLGQALLQRGAAPLHLAGHLRAESWNGRVAACFVVADAACP